MSRRVFVTGAAGFIGSHVCERLLQRGDVVVGLDNFCDYYDPGQKRTNAAELANVGGPRMTMIEADIRDQAAIEAALREAAPDVVVHLAAMAGVRASMDAPHLYFDVNLRGTLNVLMGMQTLGLDHLVFASTSSVYGATTQVPFVETDPCDRPLAPYPATKRSAELLGSAYHHLYGINFTALRFFTVYGPRGRPDMMAYKVLRSVFRGDEVLLYEGGDMHRDWTFVTDTADSVVRAVDRPMGFAVMNIGHGKPVKLGAFVAELERAAGKRANFRHAPMPASDMRLTYADSSRARELLGYEAQMGLESGVEAFVAWFRRVNSC